MTKYDIYLTGVGGQGIALLSETIARAVDYSGQRVIGADTHGLAQRGGMVSSHLRIGEKVHSVLIMRHSADLVIALERYEAFRGLENYLKNGGTLVYYDAVWQPLDVRLRRSKEIENADVLKEASKRNSRVFRVFKEDLIDSRMQNVVIIGALAKESLLPGVKSEHYIKALRDLLSGRTLERNLKVFETIAGYVGGLDAI